ncbi:MAG: hypothetical protein ACR2NY_03285 [Alphaproteobacteria bacterium]
MERLPYSINGRVGGVYYDKKTPEVVYRGINPYYEPWAKELLKCGLIDELVKKRFFPKTKISKQKIDGYNLVLEHEAISPITYHEEWTDEMYRASAIFILKVNQIANQYRFELDDPHGGNVVFHYHKPIYLDLGSFYPLIDVANRPNISNFHRKDYFLQLVLPRLESAHRANMTTLPRCLWDAKLFFIRVMLALHRRMKIYIFGYEKIANKIARLRYKTLYQRLEKKLLSYNFSAKSVWGDYQTTKTIKDKTIHQKDGRMQWILNAIKPLKINSLLDLAGNQGDKVRFFAKKLNIPNVMCVDYDKAAIDKYFLNAQHDDRMTIAAFDITKSLFPACDITERLRSDMVLAMALTHHLLISQQLAPEVMFKIFAAYSKKYLIVEFMPLGLWNGFYQPPLPDWCKETYNQVWFEKHLKKYFDIIKMAETAPNRITYLAKLKKQIA